MSTHTSTTSIRSTTMLGSFSISMWSGRKNARPVAERAENEASAKRGTLSAAKHLMVGVESFTRVVQHAAAARKFWDARTVPWFAGRGGAKAVAASAVIPLGDEIGALMAEWDGLVDTFCHDYEQSYSARVYDLGALYSVRDFPLPSEMRRRFRWSLSWDVLPSADDIRIIDAIAPEDLDRIAKAAVEQEQRRVSAAVSEIARRLHGVVKSMHETMSVKIGDPGSKFNDTKLTNVTELADIIPMLNFMQDPTLNDMAREARILASRLPDELRKDEVKRSEAAAAAGTLAQKLASMFSDDEEGEE